MRERCNYSKFLPFCFAALNFANIVIQGRTGETFLEVQIKERTIMIDLRIASLHMATIMILLRICCFSCMVID